MRASSFFEVLRGRLPDAAARLALAGVLLFSAGFLGCSSPRHDAGTSQGLIAPPVMDMPKARDIQIKDHAKGLPSAQFGENLQVWYEDLGDTVLVVTSSPQRVLLHVSTNESDPAGGGLEVVYGPLENNTFCSQYAHASASPAVCGEHQSGASIFSRHTGVVREDWWNLPKRELTTSGQAALLRFELFDETTQSSRFFPENPYSVARLTLGDTPPEPPNIVAHQGARILPARPKGVVTREVVREVVLPKEGESHREPVAAGPRYRMQLTSQGMPIEPGKRYSLSDPHFAHGPDLILAVEYNGVAPGKTDLAVSWFVGNKPVSYFPVYKIPDRSGHWMRAYDNEMVEAGEYKIILLVNGQEVSQLSFSVDAGPGSSNSSDPGK